MKKPVTSNDLKVFDDLNIQFEYAFDILNEKPVTSKDFKFIYALDIQFEYAFDILNGKTRNVERFQVF